ncbi:hypothetical protein [uncultured Chryseobacterium sp.]|uniref:hypothetical protein n=1 Tax=uncultured Chryseobacterium sp. TaxID=259322 RepID=UPI0025E4A3D8|nr:hypothetical protein [uncultured Chryseobacterium sp.]
MENEENTYYGFLFDPGAGISFSGQGFSGIQNRYIFINRRNSVFYISGNLINQSEFYNEGTINLIGFQNL